MIRTEENKEKPIIIVGAGISGLTLSILFKKYGRKVIVIEKRSPYQPTDSEDARSFNLTITERGMKSFRNIGVEHKILKKSVPLKSRVVHHPISEKNHVETTTRQFYGSEPGDMIFSIPRTELVHILYEEAQKNENSEIIFDTELMEINKLERKATVKSVITGKEEVLEFDFVIGADGAYSKTRNFLLQGEIIDFKLNYFSWFYKKFVITAEDGKNLNMDPLALHVFPKKGALVVAIPNKDGSFSSIYCTNISDPSDVKSKRAYKDIQMKFQNDFEQLYSQSDELKDTFNDSKIVAL